jgi:hypothetical protein
MICVFGKPYNGFKTDSKPLILVQKPLRPVKKLTTDLKHKLISVELSKIWFI